MEKPINSSLSNRTSYAVQVVVCMVLATGASAAMTLYLKWFLRVWSDGGFPFATTVTCASMFFQWLVSFAINAATKSSYPPLARKPYWTLAVPIGLCTSLDFLCSNLALLYISVTLFTMVKAASHVWTLLFSIWLGHQRASVPLVGVVVLVSVGITLSTYGSTSFHLAGFLLALAASLLSTLRWALTQSLLGELHSDGANHILAVVHYTSPSSALVLLPIAILYDGKALLVSKFVAHSSLLLESMGLILVGACLAFALVLAKLLLVKKTSALTLGITGSVRDTSQVLFGALFFKDPLALVNVVGLAVAVGGMLLYTLLKHRDRETAGASTRDSDSTREDLEVGSPQGGRGDETKHYMPADTPTYGGYSLAVFDGEAKDGHHGSRLTGGELNRSLYSTGRNRSPEEYSPSR
jgi:solute carrier family 35, member C2